MSGRTCCRAFAWHRRCPWPADFDGKALTIEACSFAFSPTVTVGAFAL
jgi:hypothetical protein